LLRAVRTLDRDSWASTLQFLIYLQATDHPSNSAGGSATLTTTMKWGSASATSLNTVVNMLGNTTDVITVQQ